MQTWEEAHAWEKTWHLHNPLIYYEQMKQEVYLEKMGFDAEYPDYDLKRQRILDIGGGDYSVLLRFTNFTGHVTDPLMDEFKSWVRQRYTDHGITFDSNKAEDLSLTGFDVVLFYNVLQHTQDPEKIVANARKAGKVIRCFEWIEEPVSPGHIHTLHAKDLDTWLDGTGKVDMLNDRGCRGLAYYGIFNT